MRRALAQACGVLGPAAFVGAWALAGLRTPGYSPLQQHISDLAATTGPQRPLMTAGLLAFGVLLPVFARPLGRATGAPGLATSTALAGLSTLGVAAFPVDTRPGLHAACAAVGYAATAASPVLAARRLAGPARGSSYLLGAVSATLLVASVLGPHQGLWQRLGLGIVDAWWGGLAAHLLRRG